MHLSQLRLVGLFLTLLLGSQAAEGQETSAPNTILNRKNFIYKLRPEDRIRVTIFRESDLNAVSLIDATGKVSLPLIGDVLVGQLTVSEAQEKIEQAYIDGLFLRSPQVTVSVEEYSAREVSISGKIAQPGRYPLPRESTWTVLELVTRAGGFTDTAKGTEVRVTRVGPGGKEETFIIDVESLIKGKGRNRTEDNTMLLDAGDIVYVPERLI